MHDDPHDDRYVDDGHAFEERWLDGTTGSKDSGFGSIGVRGWFSSISYKYSNLVP